MEPGEHHRHAHHNGPATAPPHPSQMSPLQDICNSYPALLVLLHERGLQVGPGVLIASGTIRELLLDHRQCAPWLAGLSATRRGRNGTWVEGRARLPGR